MKNLVRGALVASLALSSTAWAKAESWYWGFGLGYASPRYPAELQSLLDSIKAQGATHVPIAVDVGFHWPIGPATTLGISINGASDSYSLVGEASITQTGVFTTLIQAFGSEPMRGLYLRGDLGLARMGVSSGGQSAVSNYGWGVIGGAGYMLPVSDGTRLVFQATYGYRRVEGENYNLFSLTFGPMF